MFSLHHIIWCFVNLHLWVFITQFSFKLKHSHLKFLISGLVFLYFLFFHFISVVFIFNWICHLWVQTIRWVNAASLEEERTHEISFLFSNKTKVDSQQLNNLPDDLHRPEPETRQLVFILKVKGVKRCQLNQTIFLYSTLFWWHSGTRLDCWSTIGYIMFPITFVFWTLGLVDCDRQKSSRLRSSFPSPDMGAITDTDDWASAAAAECLTHFMSIVGS